MNKDRCTGECCKAFVLNNYDREVLQQAYDDEIRILTEGMWDWIRPNIQDIINPSTKAILYRWPQYRIDGILDWWPWMIYLGKFTKHPTTGEENFHPRGLDFFTCSQLSQNGDCLVYDKRPDFCRVYGADYPCEHKNCNWKGVLHKDEENISKDEIDKISVETNIESDIIRLIIKIEESILSLKTSNHNVCLALSFLLERYEKKRNKKEEVINESSSDRRKEL